MGAGAGGPRVAGVEVTTASIVEVEVEEGLGMEEVEVEGVVMEEVGAEVVENEKMKVRINHYHYRLDINLSYIKCTNEKYQY